MESKNQPQLFIVGTGIMLAGQLTLAAKGILEKADKVLYGVPNDATAKFIKSLNPTAEALPYNLDVKRRRQTYDQIVDCILAALDEGGRVCVAFYGHPGVFTDPAHMALRAARRRGYQAVMLPGISAEDCLFADLGVDPGKNGCLNYEATDFLLRGRVFDPASHLILWQIAKIGNLGHQRLDPKPGLDMLAGHLSKRYPEDHPVTVYEASFFAVEQPKIVTIPLNRLSKTPVSLISTLYIPPATASRVDPEMAARLGLSADGGAS